jgi:hypothetical protein
MNHICDWNSVVLHVLKPTHEHGMHAPLVTLRMLGEEWSPETIGQDDGGYQDLLQKCACETDIHPTIYFPATSFHMKSHTRDAKGAIWKNKGASMKDAHPTHISLSDPEEDNSSGMESFDEDDIYDGSENGDEVIFQSPDANTQSPLYGTVCPPLRSRSLGISHHIV